MEKVSVLFWLARAKNNNNKCPIYCRITVNGERAPEIATGKFLETVTDKNGNIKCKRWDYETVKNGRKHLTNDQKVLGSQEDAILINRHLTQMKNKIDAIIQELEKNEETISSKKVHAIFTGTLNKRYKLLELYKERLKRMTELLDKDYTQTTIDAYESKVNTMWEFILEYYHAPDIFVDELNHSFVANFIHWGKTKKGVKLVKGRNGVERKKTILPWNHNTTMKNLTYLKYITDECLANKWISENPFARTTITFDKPKHKFLTEDEVQKIENKDFGTDRLNKIKDVFLFCCYTGLEFSAVHALKKEHLTKNMSGKMAIFRERKKTEEAAYIPLLDKAKAIIDRYTDNPECLATGKLLPVQSNQVYNRYIKEIADLCEINKNLTTHVARHTAGTFLLNNDVDEVTVCQILGLSSTKILRSTYAKLLTKKVDQDMDKLQERLSKTV